MRRLALLLAIGFVVPGCITSIPDDTPASGGTAGAPGAGSGGTAGMSAGYGGTGVSGAAGSIAGGSGGAPSGGVAGNVAGGAGSGGITGGGAGGAGGAGSSGRGGGAGAPGGNGGSAGTSSGGKSGSSAGGAAGRGGGGAAGSGATGGAGAFDPCPPTGACKILPLGDSITDGLTVAGGYRIELFRLARQANKAITYVGGSQNGPQMVDGVTFPRAHEGHSGWTILQIDNIVPTPALGVNPHIVLLHIGTNDMLQSASVSGAPNRLGTLIDQIVTTLPNALLVVSNIIPFPGSASAVSTYNSAVPGVVRMRSDAGKHLLFVDQFAGFPAMELADGVHPNAAGYARMARAWFAAISPYLH